MAVSTTMRGSSAAPLDELIERVKSEVDVQKLVPLSDAAEDFGRYYRDHCISPDHPDRVATMMVYQDGVNCPACGFKEDAIGLYRMMRPGLNFRQVLEELLSGQWTRDEDAEFRAKEIRVLDQELGIRNHFALVQHPEALAAWERYGFTRRTVRKWQLGVARVLVRLDPTKDDLTGEVPELEWRTVNEKAVPYQWQIRFSVPVYQGGKLVQVLYRKLSEDQLGSKLTMEKDAGSWLFGLDEVDDAEEVLVVEGWGDKLIAAQNGFLAVTSTNGAGHWNSAWNEPLRRVKRLYVIGDADAAGDKLTQKVLREIPWAKPVKLPYEFGSKSDVRQFFLDGHTAADFRRLLDQADIPEFRF